MKQRKRVSEIEFSKSNSLPQLWYCTPFHNNAILLSKIIVMKKITLFAITIFIVAVASAQNTFPSSGSAGVGTITPDASSALEIKSTSQGILIPRMKKTQRDAIVSPVEGLMIYQTTASPGFYYFDGTAWKAVSPKGVNKTLSNLTAPTAVNAELLPGTGNSINLGSSSNAWKDLYLDNAVYLNGERFLASHSGTGTMNTAVGISALNANTTGYSNTGTGSYALLSNTIGTDNTANGSYALIYNTSGSGNTATGSHTLYSNITGKDNTANGYGALYLNTSGNKNIAIGRNPLFNNTTGSSNLAIGSLALYNNTTISNLVAIGDSALYNNGIGASNLSATSNTALGSRALLANTTGYDNTATGDRSLYSNINGFGNTANGSKTLMNNTVGYANTATGDAALNDNTTGNENSAYGYVALADNTTGNLNTAFGSQTLIYSVTGNYNTAIGGRALLENVSGNNNTALGYNSMFHNNTGNYNTVSGTNALYLNITGSHNVAMGNKALYRYKSDYNTAIGDSALANNVNGGTDVLSANTAVGYGALTTTTVSYDNTAIGAYSLWSNTVGNYNTSSGSFSLNKNTDGGYNVASGKNALYANTNGSNNVAYGFSSGSWNDNNNNCTFIGNDADQTVYTDFSNSTALGNTARITASNQARIGNSAVTSIGGYANWTNISDERVKKNIKENVPGLEFINKLKPVTYNLNVTGIKSFLKEDKNDDKTDNKNVNDKSSALIEQGIKEKEKVLYTGFVAQDVEAVAKKINYEFSGVDKPQDENGLYGLRYAEFVVPLVKAVQELSKKNDELQQQIDELKSMQLQGKNITGSTEIINQQTVELNGTFSLSQNMPNPFTNSTQINYYLPVNSNNAYINFYAMNGALLKSVKLSGNGKGTISVKANELSSGAYKYALMIDGKIMDSKSMIVSK